MLYDFELLAYVIDGVVDREGQRVLPNRSQSDWGHARVIFPLFTWAVGPLRVREKDFCIQPYYGYS